MSEFKYACPVCGQHMMCDESQAGSVMDCPTCFQKIVAPQVPAPGSKFILTGSKLAEKKITANVQAASVIEPQKKFPAALVVGLSLGFMAVAAGVIYWTTIIHPRQTAKNAPTLTNGVLVNAAPVALPAPVAPPANDALWSLTPTNVIPDAPVTGRIHAQDFIVERVTFRDGALMLRAGTKGAVEFGAFVNFAGAQAESLAGQSLKIMPDAERAARLQLRWKNAAGEVQRAEYTNGYALRLEFGSLLNGRLPGKIYLCAPDAEKSYLLGSFVADARKPKPKTPKK
jgi:DNA-directed RNA polymerase subunit RPC12/RpoP